MAERFKFPKDASGATIQSVPTDLDKILPLITASRTWACMLADLEETVDKSQKLDRKYTFTLRDFEEQWYLIAFGRLVIEKDGGYTFGFSSNFADLTDRLNGSLKLPLQ